MPCDMNACDDKDEMMRYDDVMWCGYLCLDIGQDAWEREREREDSLREFFNRTKIWNTMSKSWLMRRMRSGA